MILYTYFTNHYRLLEPDILNWNYHFQLNLMLNSNFLYMYFNSRLSCFHVREIDTQKLRCFSMYYYLLHKLNHYRPSMCNPNFIYMLEGRLCYLMINLKFTGDSILCQKLYYYPHMKLWQLMNQFLGIDKRNRLLCKFKILIIFKLGHSRKFNTPEKHLLNYTY